MEEEKSKTFTNMVKEKTEAMIKNLLQSDEIQVDSIKPLGELVDIHKDIVYEEYLIKEEENMRYNNYEGYGEYSEGSYGRRGRDSRGRYTEGSFGRRGVPGTGRGRYRGEEMMDEMMYHYGNYNEGREQYGADEETMKSFKYMLKSFKDYYKHLKQEASSQQEVQMLEDVAREISEM